MKKLVLIAVLISVFGLASFTQATKAIAVTSDGGGVTSPITYFMLSGQVTYKYLTYVFAAKNVTVVATNYQTGVKTSTLTDASGNYFIKVTQGQYVVKPHDARATVFSPAYRFVNVIDNSISGLNFQGAYKR